ncbi:MAG: polysaccharide biosynthesis C-terminal domain-containing protein, partial [Oscillospiraceae bacterium]|nr:polysaccharide biosynthesis C-terminal domain-containing protein [Oscillospiraceae bacterium]
MKLKKLFGAHDMTEGMPWIRIMEFAVPMLIGNIAQQLYNTADSVIVGRYVGDNALAAVGASGPILLLLLALFAGIATGAGIVVSQYYGAKDREGLGYTIGNCLMLSIIASVVIMILGHVVTRPMLVLLKTPDTILDWSAAYLTIYFVGIPGFFFYNILSGILRGMGDSVSALAALLLCTVLNVFLDILFIAKLSIPGVAGVSLATVIAQAISAVLCYVKLMQMKDV